MKLVITYSLPKRQCFYTEKLLLVKIRKGKGGLMNNPQENINWKR